MYNLQVISKKYIGLLITFAHFYRNLTSMVCANSRMLSQSFGLLRCSVETYAKSGGFAILISILDLFVMFYAEISSFNLCIDFNVMCCGAFFGNCFLNLIHSPAINFSFLLLILMQSSV